MFKLARYRNTSYFVGYTGDGGLKQFTWSGSKNGKAEIKEVPRDVVDWLTMNSVCFDKGELVIVDEDDSTKQIKESIVDAEAYTNNSFKFSSRDIITEFRSNINNKLFF